MTDTAINYQAALASSLNNDVSAMVVEAPPLEEIEQAPEPAVKVETPEPISEPTVTSTIEAIEPVTETPVFIESEYLKSRFGVETVEELQARFDQQPKEVQVFKEHEFANDYSKQIYEAILSGDEDKVADYFAKKQFVNSLKEKTPDEIVKAGWKTELGLTEAQANRRFEKMYGVDEMLDDEDKEIEQKINAKKVEDEATKYKEYFSSYAQDIKLPSLEINAPASADPIAPSPEALKAAAYATQLNKTIPTDISNIPFEFSDDKAGINLKGQVTIPQDKLAEIKANLSGNEAAFIQARYIKQDGTFNDDLWASDVYKLTNEASMTRAIISDVSHQLNLENLKRSKNYQAPGTNVQTDVELSDIELQREATRKFWGYK